MAGTQRPVLRIPKVFFGYYQSIVDSDYRRKKNVRRKLGYGILYAMRRPTAWQNYVPTTTPISVFDSVFPSVRLSVLLDFWWELVGLWRVGLKGVWRVIGGWVWWVSSIVGFGVFEDLGDL